MNLSYVFRIGGLLDIMLAVFHLPPVILAIFDFEKRTAIAYGTSAAISLLVGIILRIIGAPTKGHVLHRKDAFGIVALTWISLGFFGALPFMFEGSIINIFSAVFEAVSGFTTTGATVVADVDGLSRATNLWRCETHWIGGMGIVVLFVAVFPQLGVGAKQLFRAEVTGPSSEGLKPRIQHTAVRLYAIYTGLTVLLGLLLWLEGMSVYDAVCHAMSTLGTGGFSTRTASIGAFDSALIHWTIALFMFLAGLNFGLYYGLLHGRFRDFFSNDETRFYLMVNLLIIAIATAAIYPRLGSPLEALRHGTFQTLAVTTTTGFMTEDFDNYPTLVRWLLFGAMFMGGCAGSTAGGIKAVRIMILSKLVGREIRHSVQPQAVIPIRLGKMVVSEGVMASIAIFFGAYMLIFFAASAALTALGVDIVTGMSAAIACLSSIGPGLADVGPSQNYAAIPDAGKVILCLCMIAGRLEIFVLLAVFSRETWRR